MTVAVGCWKEKRRFVVCDGEQGLNLRGVDEFGFGFSYGGTACSFWGLLKDLNSASNVVTLNN